MVRQHGAFLLTVSIVLLTGCSTAYMRAPRELAPLMISPPNEGWKAALQPAPEPADLIDIAPASDAKTAHTSVQKRQLIYSAQLSLVVEQLSPGMREVRKIAEDCGGYLQSMDGNVISVRVPASKFNSAVQRIEDLGSVTDRRIKGQDVTEELQDLDVRLKNALEMRNRLVALLEKVKKVEDALKIEQELGRVTEKIEQFKGRMKYLKDGVAFSSISVALGTPTPRRKGQVVKLRQVPFSWVRELGSEIASGSPEYYTTKGKWFLKIRFSIPSGFVKYDEERNYTRAMSGDAVLIKVQRNKNLKGGDFEFWRRIVTRSLTEQKVITVTKTEDVKLANGHKAVMIIGTRKLGHQTFGYMLTIACNRKRVYAFEAWGLQSALVDEQDKLTESINSLRVR